MRLYETYEAAGYRVAGWALSQRRAAIGEQYSSSWKNA